MLAKDYIIKQYKQKPNIKLTKIKKNKKKKYPKITI